MLNHSIDELRMKIASAQSSINAARILLKFVEENGDACRLSISEGRSLQDVYDYARKAVSNANRALRFLEETRKELDNDCIRIDEGDGVKFQNRS